MRKMRSISEPFRIPPACKHAGQRSCVYMTTFLLCFRPYAIAAQDIITGDVWLVKTTSYFSFVRFAHSVDEIA